MEYYSFLYFGNYGLIASDWGFPSPYGVLFILMENSDVVLVGISREKFPSPYGVSFILTPKSGYMVSVQDILKFPSPYGVIFILIN